jgi:hypothetical protein
LLGIHFFGEFGFDNCKSEVEKEEGSDKDDGIEVNEDPSTNGLH